MPREVHEDTADYTIEWDDEVEALVHTWTEFTSGQEFRDGANALLEAIRDHGASKLIVDTSNVQAHDDEDKRWLRQQWVPRIVDAGVTHSATVHADTVIAEMEMEELSEEMTQPDGVEQYLTNDMADAREWMAGK